MRKLNTAAYDQARTLSMVCLGDSLTRNVNYAHVATQYYPEYLAAALRAMRVPIRGKNAGISGQTTTQMVSRQSSLINPMVPEISVLWGGHNDLTNGISTATTTANLNTLANYVLTANSTSRVVICSTHFQNFASNGDITGATPNATPSSGARLNLWNAQHVAYAARVSAYPGRVAWCDIYDYFYQLLVANPTWVGVDATWHEATTDTHLKPIGQQHVANALLATIQAQSGWVSALQVT